MAIEFTVWKKDKMDQDETFVKVFQKAEALRDFLNQSDIQTEIQRVNVFGAHGGVIQEIILNNPRDLGFQTEMRGLFRDFQLRPDFFCAVDDTGILLEVERGKTTDNNMDMLDMWKCHICPLARFLFLVVPQIKQGKSGRRQRPFDRVSKRLSAFFEPDNYVHVDAVFLFGY